MNRYEIYDRFSKELKAIFQLLDTLDKKEKAIKFLESRESIVKSRIEAINKLGDDALLDFEEFLKNREPTKRSQND